MAGGITYTEFDHIARRAFIEQALNDGHDPLGGAMTTSRIAVRTGLSRKEVARIREEIDAGNVESAATYDIGQPARALRIWYSESEFANEDGKPRVLEFDGEKGSFSALIKRVGGDVPPGAVRAELLAAGAVQELSDGRLKAVKRYYVPADFSEDLVVGLAFIVSPALETLRRAVEGKEAPFIQRVSYSDHLPDDHRLEFRQVAHGRAEELMKDIDDWLGSRESHAGPGDMSRRVGVGVFYFESPDLDGR